MKLNDINVTDLYELMDDLDVILKDYDFNSRTMAYRTGVRRMRVYLDNVASGLRMIRGGEFEPHNLLMHKKHERERN